MSREQAVLGTLILYKLVLIAIGVWANRRTRSTADFYLAGRGLGPWVAAISASASSSSAWSLLGVSGAAYAWGFSAFWLFPAVLSGYLFNWLWLAPRLRRLSLADNTITLTEWLVGADNPKRQMTSTFSTLIIVFSFSFYIASQFQASGDTFATTFGLDIQTSILIGGAIILFYTLLGGFWAVSITDTLQGLLMVTSALVLPIMALWEVGGPAELWRTLGQSQPENYFSLVGPNAGFAAVGFVAGTLGIGMGYPGQPHVVNRFMALRDEAALNKAKVIALSWGTIVFLGMLVVGWCGRALFPVTDNNEQILFSIANNLFPPAIAGVMIAAILSAIMSTADSQLLVASSSLSHDLRQERAETESIWISRTAVTGICLVSVMLALFAPEKIFSRVLFAWSALGSAFGPALIVKVAGYRIRHQWLLASLAAGFFLTVFFNGLETQPPGKWPERLVPFAMALLFAWLGRDKSVPREPVLRSENADPAR